MKNTNIIGQKFNRITVIDFDNERTTSDCIFVLGQCECGRIKSFAKYRLLSSECPQSCGCIQRELKKGKRYLPIGESAARETLRIYKENAKRRKIDFSIELEDFKRLTQCNCYYCGNPPSNKHKTRTQTQDVYIYSGLDRVDTNRGYHLDNVRPCCAICNWMKGTFTQTEFKYIKCLKRLNYFRFDGESH